MKSEERHQLLAETVRLHVRLSLRVSASQEWRTRITEVLHVSQNGTPFAKVPFTGRKSHFILLVESHVKSSALVISGTANVH